MSEYWVSQQKYYCKICGVWISDNKQTIQLHNSGVKHKINVQALDKKRKEDNLHGALNEKDLKRQLAEIENAAKASLLSNRTEYEGMFYQNANHLTAINNNFPPPPPSSYDIGGITQSNDISNGYSGGSSDNVNDLRKDTTGIYTIRNQTYLEGSIHEDKLRKGVKCEIFIEDLQGDGDWYPAIVLLRKDIPVPNTTIIIRKFDIEYKKMGSNGIELTVYSDDVRSDKLRLLANSDGTLLYNEDNEIIEKEIQIQIPISVVEETTGIGKWTTISVTNIDEVAEEKARIKAEKELQREKKENEYIIEKLSNSINNTDSSALSTYDPYGTGVYKGVKIKSEDIINHEIDSLSNGQTVTFKKRKAPTSNASMKKEKLNE